MFYNVERFVFCAHTQDFKLLLQKFEVNFENLRSKDDSTLELCGKIIIFEFKEFLSRYDVFIFVYYIYIMINCCTLFIVVTCKI